MKTINTTLFILLCTLFSFQATSQCYEFGITDGYFTPDPIIQNNPYSEATFEICNLADDLPLDPQGGMAFTICASTTYLNAVSEVTGSATEYFSFSEFGGCEIATQNAPIPAGTCLQFTIMYESLQISSEGDFIDDNGEMTGLHCITTNIVPAGIMSGSACHDVSNDYRQECTWAVVVLPVELSAFVAVKEDKETLLTWNTISEVNNERFDIERSSDGVNFRKIGEQKGSGNSNALVSYNFVDTDPLNGNNYYRLRQVDYNGDFGFSDIRQVEFPTALSRIQIYPNPTVDIVYLETKSEGTTLHVFDLLGNLVLEQSLNAVDQVSTKDFAFGNYIFRISDQNGETLLTEKLVILK